MKQAKLYSDLVLTIGHERSPNRTVEQEMAQDSRTRYGTARQTGQDKKWDMTAGQAQRQDSGTRNGTGQ